MSQRDVDYSCGFCGYPLNLSSSNRSTSEVDKTGPKSESERSAFGLTCKNWFKVRNLGRKSLTFHCCFNPAIDKEHAKCIPKTMA
uniref:Uncharacterized protein n=1 Tax=Zea mays TaxID=4577 RepID=A0A804NL93_MAIZE